MKEIFTLLAAILITAAISAQAPDKMSYQAIIRNTEGNLVTEQEVGMQISILQGSADGIAVYTETQTPTTNKNGLISIDIGGEAGFAVIDWSDGPYFIKTETDPEGGTNYTISGTNQLLTVPYALHAKTAEAISEPIVESDPVFEAHPASDIEATDISNWEEAYSWGDHSEAEYLTEEADPLFKASPAASIETDDIEYWNNALPQSGGTITGPLNGSGENTTISGFNASLVKVSSLSYTLSADNNGKILKIDNAENVTINVPSGLPPGFNCLVIQTGNGHALFEASGTSIQNRNGFTKTAGQFAIATIVHLGSDIFITSGDMIH